MSEQQSPHRRQQAQRLEVQFELPALASIETLDTWLSAVVGIDPRDFEATAQAEPASQWLLRVLLLARAMLQGNRLPVFDAPQVVSVTPSAQDARLARGAVMFPVIADHIAPAAYQLALGGALRLCMWAGARAVSTETTGPFFELMRVEVLERLERMVPGGKSTVPLLRTAHQLDIPFMHLGSGVYQLGWGSRSCRVDRSTTGRDSAIGGRMSQSKRDTARLLRMAGLPAPEHVAVREAAEARAVAARLGWPVVVKPLDRDRGEGVTVDVRSDEELLAALAVATQAARKGEALVERQVPGVCHRLFMLQGKLLYAVKRLPMSVRGDGESTVQQLVQAAWHAEQRKPPWQRSGLVPIDDAALAVLAATGLTPSSVAAPGLWVPLRRIESTAEGGVDEDMTAAVHPENVDVARRSAALFGLEVAGIDIITQDIARPWHETGAIVNEVNYAPLLGGGEISRAHIPQFLAALVPGDGRIPVDLLVGATEAAALGEQRWREQCAAGLRCWRVTPEGTFDPGGQRVVLRADDTRGRVRALVLDATVDALVIVMPEPEWRRAGPPLPGLQPRAV